MGDSCCTSPGVMGGSFYRTYENDGGGATAVADQATVSDFTLDKYEVTVGRFRQFVTAWNNGSGWTPPAGSGKHTHANGGQGLVNSGPGGGYETGWVASDEAQIAPTTANFASCGGAASSNFATWTPNAGDNESLPVNCINWWEAYAFCIWDGGFLPSEAEWEYAAAGGAKQREYPWGFAAPGVGNQYAIYDCNYPSGPGACAGFMNIAPVGTPALGAGAWGQLDLAGNVGEWVLDWKATYYPCTDCADLTAPTSSAPEDDRVIRSGSYGSLDVTELYPTYTLGLSPGFRTTVAGVRCARAP